MVLKKITHLVPISYILKFHHFNTKLKFDTRRYLGEKIETHRLCCVYNYKRRLDFSVHVLQTSPLVKYQYVLILHYL